jgi:hypothetical protein
MPASPRNPVVKRGLGRAPGRLGEIVEEGDMLPVGPGLGGGGC